MSIREALVVATICFGLFTLWSVQAVLDGFPDAEFSDASNVIGIGLELALGGFALLYLRMRDFDVGALYPRPGLGGALVGLALYAAIWVAWAAVMPLFAREDGAPEVVAFSYSGSSLALIVLFAMVNGAFEEIFLLGVMARGLRHHGLSVAVGLPLLVRILYHLYQGPAGVVSVLVFGLILTAYYLRSGRLWPVVFAHILADIVPFVLGEG
ncbi:CPBP family intramembrane glutamic endopeptidase [Marilutibacter chinensis]|uniref:CPBP family intramembrane metalloprotease n=1 Tax=Marilutibacter chinensis TaxID=2912247 RepID=A0ABS9HWY5_9GAMM|nr:CPBP family intramembrane glutamic endopeptidase [Lysobacter chinensis]MCF7223238.1 CPBP family intramembrane metalloprotease [Lysobacter chinensis]